MNKDLDFKMNSKKVQFADDDDEQLKQNLEKDIGQDSPNAEDLSKTTCKIAEYNPMFYRREK